MICQPPAAAMERRHNRPAEPSASDIAQAQV